MLFLTCYVLPVIVMIVDLVFFCLFNLLIGSALNALNLYMKYTAEVDPLQMYIV